MNKEDKTVITDLSITSLKESLQSLGFKSYAAAQILQWLYQKRVTFFEEMSNLSENNRQKLADHFEMASTKVLNIKNSSDGTCLFLFELADGKKVEAVYIPAESGRKTICLSTQVGCAMDCTFCRTGQMGLMRNLTQGEILEQVLAIQRCFPGEEITNLVFMGMGEPMANLSQLVPAIEILKDPKMFGFPKKKITVSTAGLVPKMVEFVQQVDVKLAISLHAPNDSLRDQLMPINKRYPLKVLMEFCREFSKGPRNLVTFEYVMLKNVNDSPDLCKELVQLLEGIPSKINLIPFNPFPTVDYQPSDNNTIKQWVDILYHAGIQTNVRANRGRDILAACGQLAA